MPATYILALDQGTSSSRAILFDAQGQVRGVEQQEFTQFFPKPGWVEHDALEIWQSQLGVARAVLAKSQLSAKDIAAIGITNQRETTVLWERATGKPVHPAIVWQDKRGAELCARLKKEGQEAMLREKTGLVADAYFSATKLRWLLDHVPEAQARAERGELCFGTIDTWLLYNLSDKALHLTDVSNASRTLLYNIHEQRWDADLLALFGIPAAVLPEVRPSSQVYGHSAASCFGGAIPIAGMAGDQQAALFGQACHAPGMAKNTYGTGCFMLMNTGEKAVRSEAGLLSTVAWQLEGERPHYALEGSVFIAGAAVQWLRDGLKIIDETPDSEYYALKIKDSEGVYVVPAFAGLGAPYWDMYARGAIFGLTRGTSKAHIIRATLEALAYQTKDVLEAMQKDAGIPLHALRVDGGASANGLLMQFQADVLDVPVERPRIIETTALGAAYLAGLAVGLWGKADLQGQWQLDKRFLPDMPADERQRRYQGWLEAVRRTMGWLGEA